MATTSPGSEPAPDGMDGVEALAALVAARVEPGPGPGASLVGLAGPVAAGKTTLAGRLADTLAATGVDVTVMGTDAFLLPNATLASLGIGWRKGFPESFDTARLDGALAALRSGRAVDIPVYSHSAYDIVEGATDTVIGSGVVIVEGVNALQPPLAARLDAGVYLHADETVVFGWFVERFHTLRREGRDDPESFYATMAALDDGELEALAAAAWDGVNLPNLREHIVPSRVHATWVVEKAADHSILEISAQEPAR